MRIPRITFALAAAVFLLAAGCSAQPAATEKSAPEAVDTKKEVVNPAASLGLPGPLGKKLQTFFERHSPVSPDRTISLESDWREPPSGMSVVRVVVTSAIPRLNGSILYYLSDDFSSVFSGQAIKLDKPGSEILGENGQKLVTEILNEKTGVDMSISWTSQSGPASTWPATIEQVLDWARVPMTGYLSADGEWLLIGDFFPLDRDPREVRMERLDLPSMPAKGPADAPVTLVEFSDYECPSCGLHQKDVDEVLKQHPGKIRLVHVDHPIFRIHDWALAAAIGSRCVEAWDADAYWKYKDLVFQAQENIDLENIDEFLEPIIMSLGMDFGQWKACRDDGGESATKVAHDLGIGYALGVHGTPTFFVNGLLVSGGIDQTLKMAVEQALAGAAN